MSKDGRNLEEIKNVLAIDSLRDRLWFLGLDTRRFTGKYQDLLDTNLEDRDVFEHLVRAELRLQTVLKEIKNE